MLEGLFQALFYPEVPAERGIAILVSIALLGAIVFIIKTLAGFLKDKE